MTTKQKESPGQQDLIDNKSKTKARKLFVSGYRLFASTARVKYGIIVPFSTDEINDKFKIWWETTAKEVLNYRKIESHEVKQEGLMSARPFAIEKIKGVYLEVEREEKKVKFR